MKRAVSVLAAGLLATPVLVAGSPAWADSGRTATHRVADYTVTPDPVVVRTVSPGTGVKVQVRVRNAERVSIELTGRSYRTKVIAPRRVQGSYAESIWEGTGTFNGAYDWPGTWTLRTTVTDAGGTTAAGPTGPFTVQYGTKLSINAKPEWVDKPGGGGIRLVAITGNLTRLSLLDGDEYAGYRGQKVSISFREKGTSIWTHVGTAETGTGGAYSLKLREDRNGDWSVRYAGAADYTPAYNTTDEIAFPTTRR